MYQLRGQTTSTFGLDQTNLIKYCFNQQGFRGNTSYNQIPRYAFFGCSLVFGIGVDYHNTFVGKFTDAYNYGIAGDYTNADTFEIIKSFLNSKLFSLDVKLAVVWTDRDSQDLYQYVDHLQKYNIVHFFCGDPLPGPHCYKVMSNLDVDVSGTHMGIKTHEFFYKVLCNLL